jgi:hypothetical protein
MYDKNICKQLSIMNSIFKGEFLNDAALLDAALLSKLSIQGAWSRGYDFPLRIN